MVPAWLDSKPAFQASIADFCEEAPIPVSVPLTPAGAAASLEAPAGELEPLAVGVSEPQAVSARAAMERTAAAWP